MDNSWWQLIITFILGILTGHINDFIKEKRVRKKEEAKQAENKIIQEKTNIFRDYLIYTVLYCYHTRNMPKVSYYMDKFDIMDRIKTFEQIIEDFYSLKITQFFSLVKVNDGIYIQFDSNKIFNEENFKSIYNTINTIITKSYQEQEDYNYRFINPVSVNYNNFITDIKLGEYDKYFQQYL